MLNLLSSRENGLNPPGVLVKAESCRRAFNVGLSKHREVQGLHQSPINVLDIDKVEGRYLLSSSSDASIAIHDLDNTTGIPQYTSKLVCNIGKGNKFRHKFSVETVLWYPHDTGMFISSGFDKLLKVWDTNLLLTADEYEFGGVVYSHHMSPIARKHCLVAVATQSSKVKLVDLKSGSASHTLKGHRQPVLSVRWSTSNEHVLATGGEDGKAMLWDVRRAKGCLMTLDQHDEKSTSNKKKSGNTSSSTATAHSGSVNGLCFTSDGLHLVTLGTDHKIRLWNTSTGKNTLVNYGKIDNDSRKCVKFSITENCSEDVLFVPSFGDISMYDLFSGDQINTLRGHFNQVNCCYFHPWSQELYSAGNDRNILVWCPETGTETAYEEYIKEENEAKRVGRTKIAAPKASVTADTWSSDED